MISLKTDKQLNTEAIELREKWGLNPYGSVDITSVVLSKIPDITLLYIPFSEKTSGMCIKDENIQIIGINDHPFVNGINTRLQAGHGRLFIVHFSSSTSPLTNYSKISDNAQYHV